MGAVLNLRNTKIKRGGDGQDMAQTSESEIKKLRKDHASLATKVMQLEERIEKLEKPVKA